MVSSHKLGTDQANIMAGDNDRGIFRSTQEVLVFLQEGLHSTEQYGASNRSVAAPTPVAGYLLKQQHDGTPAGAIGSAFTGASNDSTEEDRSSAFLVSEFYRWREEVAREIKEKIKTKDPARYAKFIELYRDAERKVLKRNPEKYHMLKSAVRKLQQQQYVTTARARPGKLSALRAREYQRVTDLLLLDTQKREQVNEQQGKSRSGSLSDTDKREGERTPELVITEGCKIQIN